jgi:hypothetical protein
MEQHSAFSESIQSPQIFTLKRRLDCLYSPNEQEMMHTTSIVYSPMLTNAKKSTSKRLFFQNELEQSNDSLSSQTSPCSMDGVSFQFIDENSCDSGFSELKDDEIVDELGTTFNEDETSFELLDKFDLKTEVNFESQMLINKKSLKSSFSSSDVTFKSSTRSLKFKSKSFNQASTTFYDENLIKTRLDISQETFFVKNDRLIGDMSREHVLPVLKNCKHRDLASISSETMADLLGGKYNEKIDKYFVLDARYPYEYEGGHIHCAENVYLKDKLIEKLFNEPIQTENGKPVVLIFHCEFSSERGPKLMREIRERDRMLNKDNYPNLFYPEIYLLEGGYKAFYEQFDDFCAPKSYMPMLHDNHRDDMKFFRRKSKSWQMESKSKTSRTNTKPLKTKLSF